MWTLSTYTATKLLYPLTGAPTKRFRDKLAKYCKYYDEEGAVGISSLVETLGCSVGILYRLGTGSDIEPFDWLLFFGFVDGATRGGFLFMNIKLPSLPVAILMYPLEIAEDGWNAAKEKVKLGRKKK